MRSFHLLSFVFLFINTFAVSYTHLGEVGLELVEEVFVCLLYTSRRGWTRAGRRGLCLSLIHISARLDSSWSKRSLSVSYTHLGEVGLELVEEVFVCLLYTSRRGWTRAGRRGLCLSLIHISARLDSSWSKRSLSVSYTHLGEVGLELVEEVFVCLLYTSRRGWTRAGRRGLCLSLIHISARLDSSWSKRSLSVSYTHLGEVGLELVEEVFVCLLYTSRRGWTRAGRRGLCLSLIHISARLDSSWSKRSLSVSYTHLGEVGLELVEEVFVCLLYTSRRGWTRAGRRGLCLSLIHISARLDSSWSKRSLSVSYTHLGEVGLELVEEVFVCLLYTSRRGWTRAGRRGLCLSLIHISARLDSSWSKRSLSVSYTHLGEVGLELVEEVFVCLLYTSRRGWTRAGRRGLCLSLIHISARLDSSWSKRSLSVSYTHLGEVGLELVEEVFVCLLYTSRRGWTRAGRRGLCLSLIHISARLDSSWSKRSLSVSYTHLGEVGLELVEEVFVCLLYTSRRGWTRAGRRGLCLSLIHISARLDSSWSKRSLSVSYTHLGEVGLELVEEVFVCLLYTSRRGWTRAGRRG
ncbi:hypothetical protein DEO72_LG7g186 [Vigna unguiculata]|uniref:Uncharacterized protein n=1 Tax=Vigna unguiculata TaxID=3917 RepID=A0A4D6MF11_VIGUN|nr:hypothetical protein DEO72_LG7g186 [Vigna unguiculata]